MLDSIKAFVRDRRYGAPVVIVSGLPRSGTSMMMKMLDAGGFAPMQDGERTADIDNPKGYFEYERVKDLEAETDKSYVQQGRGKALKVISFLIPHLPMDNQYRVLFMRRDLDEVIASQNKMVDRLQQGGQDVDDEMLKEAYRNDIVKARLYCKKHGNFELLEVHYRKTIDDPETTARAVNDFLGGGMDIRKMAEVVDPDLYRNRA